MIKVKVVQTRVAFYSTYAERDPPADLLLAHVGDLVEWIFEDVHFHQAGCVLE